MKIKTSFNLLVIFLAVIAALIWAFVLFQKYSNFGYYDWDLAIYSQAMWRMVHGSLHASLFGMNFLGNHPEYISFLVAPLYFFFQHPLTLVYLNVAAFFIGAYTLYLVFRKYLSPWYAAVLFLLYIIYPANLFMLVYEFHFESLAIPFIAGMFLFFIEKKFFLFIICGFLACLCKENMPSIMVMFGILSLFRRDVNRWQWAVVPIVIGLLYFCCVMFVVSPYIRRDLPHVSSAYLSMFSPRPSGFFFALNANYFKDLFMPLIFIPFIGCWPLLLCVPIFFQNLFSSASNMHTIYFHYTATIAPFIFVSAAVALNCLNKMFRPLTFRVLLLLMISASVLAFIANSEALEWQLYQARDRYNDVQEKMLSSIPAGEPVVASFKFLSHLSCRNEVYAFYNVWLGKNLFTGGAFELPAFVRYAIVDLADPWLKGAYREDHQGVSKRVHAFLNDGWKVLGRSKGLLLLRR